jgi:Alpha galactosidase C-terminal beta sandwich domain
MVVGWESVGLHDQRPCLARDLWTHKDLGVFTSNLTVTVGRHDVALLKLTPVK